jgi:hypothetical protein
MKYIPEVILACWWFSFAFGAPYKNSAASVFGVPVIYITAIAYGVSLILRMASQSLDRVTLRNIGYFVFVGSLLISIWVTKKGFEVESP